MTDLEKAQDQLYLALKEIKGRNVELLYDYVFEAHRLVKKLTIPHVSISLVDAKFMKWLAKEAPELCESLYNCIHDYETNEC